MQSQLQSSFQRVEQALHRLTDSIAAYNPDVRAAEELEAADAAVNEDLKKLATHQRNYLRKEELRRQTDAYDAEIKGKIRNISDTRKELVNIPAYNTADCATREIEVGELLRYAKFISRTTVPPTLPKQESKPSPAVTKEETKPPQLTNGPSTPPPDTQPREQNGTAEQDDKAAEAKFMTAGQRAWINGQLNFEAWPEHWTIQGGALGAIQRMVEAGEDPASVLSKEEQAEVARRKAEEEERERVEMEERERRWAAGGGMRRRETVEEVFNPDEI